MFVRFETFVKCLLEFGHLVCEIDNLLAYKQMRVYSVVLLLGELLINTKL